VISAACPDIAEGILASAFEKPSWPQLGCRAHDGLALQAVAGCRWLNGRL
jgi:hypothetical protein